eukprot:304742-Chlamydomonas_euryale.AAC.1
MNGSLRSDARSPRTAAASVEEGREARKEVDGGVGGREAGKEGGGGVEGGGLERVPFGSVCSQVGGVSRKGNSKGVLVPRIFARQVFEL